MPRNEPWAAFCDKTHQLIHVNVRSLPNLLRGPARYKRTVTVGDFYRLKDQPFTIQRW